ncbi:alpha/beta hydrolase [Antribacter gilvus]|uniref:alpha/beta hydrolase n=1 Tax=Antribacter gilvus TaxID=2304675 RepID=UPI000F76E833|nr:alpha/beta hydrolase [Antribacter gilvus]
MTAWHDDVLGPDFQARSLPLPDEGADGVTATLVRHVASTSGATSDDVAGSGRPAVLYVHGFVDYFFHRHVAETFAARGYPFYAVDLRGYGRSLREGGDPNYVRDVAVHALDLDAATEAIRAEGHERIVVLAHSMGGLVASLWANSRPGRAEALVLNSPWLDLNEGWHHRIVTTRLLHVLGPVAPRLRLGGLSESYGRALHGEWGYDLAWKPYAGFPVRAAWLHSIRRAHARVARGLDVTCPVLVCASDRTSTGKRWHDELLTTDSVLDVRHILALAPKIGRSVDVVTIPGGAHDLALSAEPVRQKFLTTALDWLDARV